MAGITMVSQLGGQLQKLMRKAEGDVKAIPAPTLTPMVTPAMVSKAMLSRPKVNAKSKSAQRNMCFHQPMTVACDTEFHDRLGIGKGWWTQTATIMMQAPLNTYPATIRCPSDTYPSSI